MKLNKQLTLNGSINGRIQRLQWAGFRFRAIAMRRVLLRWGLGRLVDEIRRQEFKFIPGLGDILIRSHFTIIGISDVFD